MFVRCPRSLSFQLRAISASVGARKFHYTRGNTKFIGHRVSHDAQCSSARGSVFPRDGKKRFPPKKVVIYLRDRIGEWVDSDIIETPFNPIRIYEFYGISLWMQLIASGIKSSFMGRRTDSRGHRRTSGSSSPCFGLRRSRSGFSPREKSGESYGGVSAEPISERARQRR